MLKNVVKRENSKIKGLYDVFQQKVGQKASKKTYLKTSILSIFSKQTCLKTDIFLRFLFISAVETAKNKVEK